MTAVPVLPKGAPFSAEDVELLNRVVARATPVQRSWLAGFLAGYDAALGHGAQPAASARPKVPLTILYASESGNAEGLALKARKVAQKSGFDAQAVDMGEADLSILTKAKTLLIYAATWGEGDPPQRAADFYAKLMGQGAPRLDGVRFAVLGLGDTAYVNFCATARAIDARLEALGAVRAAPRIDLDLDFAQKAAAWTENTLALLAPPEALPSATVVHVDFKGALHADVDADEPLFTAESPLDAEISALINLNGTGSSRETWHVELAAGAPGFSYRPGDAIGVVPENDPELVAELLETVGLGGDEELQQTLRLKHDVTTLTRPLVEAYAKLTGRADVAKLAQPDAYASFAADRQLVDLFQSFPEKLSGDQLKGLLRPLPGRLYSVASSPLAHPGEAHLLIGAVRWSSHGKARKGVASTYFADRRTAGEAAKIYVRPNRHFRLPEDQSRPIIMIGAGTGIAPYRGFIEERAETGAKGKSWLFFGERNYTYDFLYQLEWQEHVASGVLSCVDVAFSRDQPEKVYVQHRLWERRAEILNWLEDGAHLYVCGDEKGMARDVDTTLVRILSETAKGDEEAGKARLGELRREGRYQRDVY